jgi:hypothetical protein
MRKLAGCVTLLVFLVGAFFFVRQWRSTAPWGAGTGTIAGNSHDSATRDKRSPVVKARSTLAQIIDNPTRFTNKTVTVTGRVRGAGRLASNRNIYRLTQGEYRLLVIDDKPPPKDLALRTVSGRVKLIKPPLGTSSYAYLVSVKEGVKFNEPSWREVSGWFTGTYGDVKKVVKDVVKEW